MIERRNLTGSKPNQSNRIADIGVWQERDRRNSESDGDIYIAPVLGDIASKIADRQIKRAKGEIKKLPVD